MLVLMFYSTERVRTAELRPAAERTARGFHPGLPSSHEGGRGGRGKCLLNNFIMYMLQEHPFALSDK